MYNIYSFWIKISTQLKYETPWRLYDPVQEKEGLICAKSKEDALECLKTKYEEDNKYENIRIIESYFSKFCPVKTEVIKVYDA